MKKMVTLAFALVVLAGVASAQKTDSTFRRGFAGRHMAMRHFGRQNAGRGINLTDAQKTQMKTINDDYRKQLSTLQSNNSLTMGDYKTQLAALQKSHREKISGVFTDDQKKTMASTRQRMHGRMQARGAVNLERMKDSLGLSDDQVAKLKEQREQMRTQLQAVRRDSTLLPAQKGEKVRELFAQQKEQLTNVLTPDQLTRLESMRKERMNHARGRHIMDDQVK